MSLTEHSGVGGTVTVTWRLPGDPQDVWNHLTDVARLPEWLGQWRSGIFAVGDELV